MSLKNWKINANMPALRWILWALTAWNITLNVSLQAQIPTKPRHVTISELAGKNAVKYKIDAEIYYRQGLRKDTIIAAQDTVIKKQEKKLFWKNVENWAWRVAGILTAIKLLSPK